MYLLSSLSWWSQVTEKGGMADILAMPDGLGDTFRSISVREKLTTDNLIVKDQP